MTAISPPKQFPSIALTIAGSDSGGGAGIQADLKTMSALGVYGASVLTALTAQNTLGVRAIHDVPIDFIASQIDAVYEDLSVGATKIGMLSQSAVIETVARGLDRYGAHNIVLDPVMVATSNDILLVPEAISTLKEYLIPRADIITPNLREAALLLDTDVAQTALEMQDQAKALLSLGAHAVLIKGGHFDTDMADDLYVTATETQKFSALRVDTRNTHGTGCTLSAAIASFLAKGLALSDAIAQAKIYVSGAIGAADQLTIGHGPGPVHHFHNIW